MVSNARNTEGSPRMASVVIPTPSGGNSIDIEGRKPVFILGRNGVGKSALVHKIFSDIGGSAVYLPGSRPAYFEQEGLSMSPTSRRQLGVHMLEWDRLPDTRWRVTNATSRNDKAVHDIQAAETQYVVDAAEEIRRSGREAAAITRLQLCRSPLDRINSIFSQSNLPVCLKIDGGELKAVREGCVYSFARMSDGERVALVFASEVLSARPGSIFIVDEPELHLHPAIVVPFVSSLISERPDCGFLISTHVLDLPSAFSSAKVILVRAVNWQSNQAQSWLIDVIENAVEIPESLRVDLLGSRQNILFIEGNANTSLDQPLYGILFPAVSIRPKETCRDVINAVKGLRAAENLHRVKAYGLVDHDGLSEVRVSELEAEGIYPLSIFSVEGLYYCSDVLEAVANQQAQTFGYSTAELLAAAREQAFASIERTGVLEHLAARLAERRMRDLFMDQMPTRNSMVANEGDSLSISFVSPYPAELEKLKMMVEQKNLDGIVARYPVRESGMLNSLAKSLRMPGREEYERAALVCIKTNISLQISLKRRLGNVVAALEGKI